MPAIVPSPIPEAPGALPLIGHALPLLRDPLGFMRSLPAHADLVRVRLGPVEAVMVTALDLTRTLLRQHDVFDKGGPIYDKLREGLGNGLGTCPFQDHQRQRQLVQPAFRSDRITRYAALMTNHIDTVTASWNDGDVIDAYAEMGKIAGLTLGQSILGGVLPPKALTQVLADAPALMEGVVTRAVTPPFLQRLPTPANRRYHQARSRLRETALAIIRDHRAAGTDHGDIVSVLLTGEEQTQTVGTRLRGLTDEEIVDQIITFLVAGTDTSQATVAWALYQISRHPDIEERLHAEVDTVLGLNPAAHHHLSRLPLTTHIITETLRLCAPVWLITRTVTADTALGAHRLPAGTTVAFSPYLLHTRPDLFPDPQRFDPDRWARQHPTPPRGALIPFSAGKRKCLGDQFATTELTLALATITARWRLTPSPTEPHAPSSAWSPGHTACA